MRQIPLQRIIRRYTALQRQLHNLDSRFSSARLGLFGLLMLSVVLDGFTFNPWQPVISLALVTAFAWTWNNHRLIRTRHHAVQAYLVHYRAQLARATHDWAHIPPSAYPFKHLTPLERDCDLPQLHRLLDTTTTQTAHHQLREVLREADLNTCAERQADVQELMPQVRFRTKLWLVGTLRQDPTLVTPSDEQVSAWLNRSERQTASAVLWLLGLQATLNLLVLGMAWVGGVPRGVAVVVWLVYVGHFAVRVYRMGNLFEDAATLLSSLRLYERVFVFLERASYQQMPRLKTRVAPILQDSPTRHLQRTTLVFSLASLRGNPLVWLALNLLLPFDYLVGWLLERERAQLHDRLPQWLQAWHHAEVMSSLANFAWLNPSYTFPTFTHVSDSALHAADLAHPLIAPSARVGNTLQVDVQRRLHLVTGSNMSGKSSLLRAIGLNLCLAYAGTVVCADELRVGAFHLVSVIRVSDDLEHGISYFYAEVQALSQLYSRVQQGEPIFYLIDEVFRGTNNQERLQGARDLLCALVAHPNAYGFITTHDLLLAEFVATQAHMCNVHFRDELQGQRMTFDYRLREGVGTTTNALRIMALAGLPIEHLLRATD